MLINWLWAFFGDSPHWKERSTLPPLPQSLRSLTFGTSDGICCQLLWESALKNLPTDPPYSCSHQNTGVDIVKGCYYQNSPRQYWCGELQSLPHNRLDHWARLLPSPPRQLVLLSLYDVDYSTERWIPATPIPEPLHSGSGSSASSSCLCHG